MFGRQFLFDSTTQKSTSFLTSHRFSTRGSSHCRAQAKAGGKKNLDVLTGAGGWVGVIESAFFVGLTLRPENCMFWVTRTYPSLGSWHHRWRITLHQAIVILSVLGLEAVKLFLWNGEQLSLQNYHQLPFTHTGWWFFQKSPRSLGRWFLGRWSLVPNGLKPPTSFPRMDTSRARLPQAPETDHSGMKKIIEIMNKRHGNQREMIVTLLIF